MSQRKFSIITINYNNKEGLRKNHRKCGRPVFLGILSILLLTEGLRMEVLK